MTAEDQTRGDSEGDIDYQIGQYDAEGGGVDLGEGSEFLPWDLEVQTAIKRLAIDIYSSDESGVAEPETNATATIIEAVEEGFLSSVSDGEVTFTIRENPIDEELLNDASYDGPESELELTIEDNGMGMTDSTVRKVLRVLGRTLTKDSGNRSGQFGMGFVAIFLLAGWDAALELHTHSRMDGEEPISAVINNRGITIDHEEQLDGRMGEDEYGTRLKLILKDDISKDDMRMWVQKNAEYARTPVVYRELNATGNETYKREYGMKQLEADFDEEAPIVTYEDEFIRAVLSPEADGRTFNLDVPIRRGYTRNGPLPWSFDIRLKNENRPVVESPDESEVGIFVTERGQYEDMEAERQALYTHNPQSDAIVMAGVAGTRDTLKKEPDFWKNYVIDNLYTEYKTKVQNILQKLESASDFRSLTNTEIQFVGEAVTTQIDSWVNTFGHDRSQEDYTADQLVSDIYSKFDVELDSDVARVLRALSQEVIVVYPEDPMGEKPSYNYPDEFGEREIWGILEDDYDRAFMGVSINEKKADVVWEDSEDNIVVQLETASEYEALEAALGWECLADVKTTTIDDFDISDELRSEFQNNVGSTEDTSVEETEVTITYQTLKTPQGRRYGQKWVIQRDNVTAQEVRNDFKSYELSGTRPSYGKYPHKCKPRRLILFPDSGEANISDYYWIASKDVALAKVSDDVAEFLLLRDDIVTFEEYKAWAENQKLSTSQGECFPSDCSDMVVYHLLETSVAERFKQAHIAEGMEEALKEIINGNTRNWPRMLIDTDFVYVPITRSELVHTRYNLASNDKTFLLTGDEFFKSEANQKELDSDTQLYAKSAFLGIDDAPEEVEKFFQNVTTDLKSGGMTVVDELVNYYGES